MKQALIDKLRQIMRYKAKGGETATITDENIPKDAFKNCKKLTNIKIKEDK